ncbi:hypothetical protein [Shimia sp. FJ5]|uniref:hypothetical protein n=1 Tax=Shimia sp. FJ5 TaxID=3079054 RepID=UPI00293DAEF9|nr:hypothetical protein [Shimia sp. FJ5]MDV4146448.1 hypothetical protein [Shimia sp. FJ5]
MGFATQKHRPLATCATLAICLLIAEKPALAEDYRSRAEQSISQDNATSTFTDETVQEIVSPFETDAPPETGYSHTEFEDKIAEIRNAETNQGRVLRATEDSALVRPDVDIDGQGPLFDDANWAHENAEAVAGQYFSDELGNCEEPHIPVSQTIDMFCESMPARAPRSCDLTREIWVDRTDTWRCDKRAAQFTKICTKNIQLECANPDGPISCLANQIEVEGEGVTSSWAGNTLTITFAAPEHPVGPPAAPGFGAGPTDGWAALVKHEFKIRISDRVKPSSVLLQDVTAKGVAQLLVKDGAGRDVLDTYVDTLETDYRAATPQRLDQPKAQACFGDPDEALIVPSNSISGTTPVPMVRAVEFERVMVDGQMRFTGGGATQGEVPASWFTPVIPAAPRILDGQFDFANGSFGDLDLSFVSYHPTASGWRRRFMNVTARIQYDSDYYHEYYEFFWNCDDLATLSGGNLDTVKDTFRFLDVERFETTVPDAPARWIETEFELRVVYLTGSAEGGAASVAIDFEGPCCDTFENVGDEICD